MTALSRVTKGLLCKEIEVEQIDRRLVGPLMEALDVDEDLQNHRPVDPSVFTLGMDAALHGIWAGRAVYREIKLAELEARRKNPPRGTMID